MSGHAAERISFARWWIQHVRDGLFAMDKLPPGPLGDWAFLFREQLNDALNEPPVADSHADLVKALEEIALKGKTSWGRASLVRLAEEALAKAK